MSLRVYVAVRGEDAATAVELPAAATVADLLGAAGCGSGHVASFGGARLAGGATLADAGVSAQATVRVEPGLCGTFTVQYSSRDPEHRANCSAQVSVEFAGGTARVVVNEREVTSLRMMADFDPYAERCAWSAEYTGELCAGAGDGAWTIRVTGHRRRGRFAGAAADVPAEIPVDVAGGGGEARVRAVFAAGWCNGGTVGPKWATLSRGADDDRRPNVFRAPASDAPVPASDAPVPDPPPRPRVRHCNVA